MSGDYSYEIESYAWITILDESALKLNSFVRQYGYEFIKIRLHELEKFRNLFGLSENCKNKEYISINSEKGVNGKSEEKIISNELYEILIHTVHDGLEILRKEGVIFLRRIENFSRQVINYGFTDKESSEVNNEMSPFVLDLIQKMRLFRNGDIACKAIFQIAVESRKVVFRYSPSFLPGGNRKLVVCDEDIMVFGMLLQSQLKVNHLTELAFSTFNLTYQIPEIRSKYLMFMICLESLFNLGFGEISHTVSRHLAIALAKDEGEFHIIYNRMKKLYSYRSKIVHGSKLVEDLLAITNELQDLVRDAIIYCLKIDKTKVELHAYLNSKGF